MSRLELAGWIIFLMSGVAFLISGVVAEDPWVIAGSVLFVLGILAVVFGARQWWDSSHGLSTGQTM